MIQYGTAPGVIWYLIYMYIHIILHNTWCDVRRELDMWALGPIRELRRRASLLVHLWRALALILRGRLLAWGVRLGYFELLIKRCDLMKWQSPS